MAATDTSASPTWPLTAMDPAAWLRAWSAAMQSVPHTLDQSINPGWNFGPVLNINGTNSSAPQTEVEVLQHHSYGRQLGRMADAMALLIAERGKNAPADPRVDAFLKMKLEIDRIKLDAAAGRVDALRADLAALKASRPAEYERLRGALRKVLAG